MKQIRQSLGGLPKYSEILFRALKTPLIIYFAVIGNLITFSSAYLFLRFEQAANTSVNNSFDALYWAFATVSTVGYGDITPLTVEGKMIAMFLMVFGVLFIIGFTAILVSVVYGLAAKEIDELEQIGTREYHVLLSRLDAIENKLKILSKD